MPLLREAHFHLKPADRNSHTKINTLTARGSPHYSPEYPAKEPSVQDTLNKPWTPHQDAMRDSKSPYVGSPTPLVCIINSSTRSVPPPFYLATVYL